MCLIYIRVRLVSALHQEKKVGDAPKTYHIERSLSSSICPQDLTPTLLKLACSVSLLWTESGSQGTQNRSSLFEVTRQSLLEVMLTTSRVCP